MKNFPRQFSIFTATSDHSTSSASAGQGNTKEQKVPALTTKSEGSGNGFTQPLRAFFTTTSEEQNEHSYSFFPSAVGANPCTANKNRGFTFFLSAAGEKSSTTTDGFTTASEVYDESLLSSSPNAVGGNPFLFAKRNGFTMVELLVAIGVFATALTMAMTGLLATIDTSSRTRSVSETVNNLNFAVDDMARRIRTGYNFNCGTPTGGDCPNGDNFFSFTDSRGLDTSSHSEVRYQQNGSHIERWEDGSWTTITSDSITIDDLIFYVTGVNEDDDEQTRVMISIAGTAGYGDTQESFQIHTSITQRLLYPSKN